MKILSIYQIFLLFIIYSFIGWTCEVLYCSIYQKKFVNRGFLYGPICPIYGCGALMFFFFLMPLAYNVLLLFFSAMFLMSVLEYFVSWAMEKLFDTKWWDYSHYKFNINGRVCLLNSTLFGVMGVIAVKFVHPMVLKLIYSLNDFWTKTFAIILLSTFIVDLAFTLKSLVDFKIYLRRFEDFIQFLLHKVEQEKWVIDIHDNIEEFVKKIKEKISSHETSDNSIALVNENLNREIDKKLSIFSEKRKAYKRYVIKFPKMKSKRFSKSLNHIKSLLKK